MEKQTNTQQAELYRQPAREPMHDFNNRVQQEEPEAEMMHDEPSVTVELYILPEKQVGIFSERTFSENVVFSVLKGGE